MEPKLTLFSAGLATVMAVVSPDARRTISRGLEHDEN